MLSTLVSIAFLQWLALVTPGANVLLVSQLAASGNRQGALCAGLGVSCVAVSWAVLALLGINALFTALPQLRLALQLIGGAYLCYIAVRLWRSSAPASSSKLPALSPLAAFKLGLVTNVLNPKSALFFGSVFATALPENPSVGLQSAAVLLVTANALAWHTFLAFAFSAPGIQTSYAKHHKTLTRIAGLGVGTFGLRLVITAAADLRGKA